MTERLLRLRQIFILVIVIICSNNAIYSQELNCMVEVNASQIEGTDKSVFTTLQEAISEYFNTRKWTNAQFSVNEKIECRFYLTVSEYSDDKFVGDVQVQLSRPVYNSTYTTTLLNFKDTKIEFTYQENESLIFNEHTMESNLTAILNRSPNLIGDLF